MIKLTPHHALVHPNVDKASFIRWKQRDIHDKRMKRHADMRRLNIDIETYDQLTKRIDFLITTITDDETWLDEKHRNAVLATYKGDKDKPFDPTTKETLVDLPSYNEMVEDLLTQGDEKVTASSTLSEKVNTLKQFVLEHKDKVAKVTKENVKKLFELKEEEARHITSEDIHDGFNYSSVNKIKDEPTTSSSSQSAKASSSGSASSTKIETINSPDPSSKAKEHKTKPESNNPDDVDLTVSPESKEFSTIDPLDLKESEKFILKHLFIATEQQKDALIMTAFDYQLKGEIKRAQQIVHQALLLKYTAELTAEGKNSRGVYLFFDKMRNNSDPARKAFLEDLKLTYDHVVNRCKILKNEGVTSLSNNDNDKENAEEEGVEQIQLQSLDPDQPLMVNIPPLDSENYPIYETLEPEMRKAIETLQLSEVNKVLAKYTVDEAEKILGVFEECGVITVEEKILEPNEWNELQEARKADLEEHEERPEVKLDSVKEEPSSSIVQPTESLFTATADIVD